MNTDAPQLSFVDAHLGKLPEDAKDLRMNLRALLDDASIGLAHRYGTAIAVATALHAVNLRDALTSDARAVGVPEGTIADATAAAAIMGMTNVYYRFRHLVGDVAYEALTPRLRMQRLAGAKSNKEDLELFALAVSAVNNCEFCVKAHDRKLRDSGVEITVIHDAVRIASVVHAAAAFTG